MFQKIKALIYKYREIIIYLFFGGLTTLVDWEVFWPLHYWLHWPAVVSNAVAWIVAVIYAFLTNKPFVFNSDDWRPKTLFPEFWKFVACRFVSFVFAEVFLFITVDWLDWHGFLMKVLVSIVVIILNYIGSKLLVFRKKRRD